MIDFKEVPKFLDTMFLEILRSGIDVSYYELDHICYRVETLEEYEESKAQLSDLGELLSETNINGRPISTYKLSKALKYQNRDIFVVELPAPKEIPDYKTGFEHVEFVIDQDFDEFISKHQNIKFDLKGIGKEINPDIRVIFEDISVKFHRNSLEHVIEFEQK